MAASEGASGGISKFRRYTLAGLSVLPLAPYSKEPAHVLLPSDPETGRRTWAPFQETIPSAVTIASWTNRQDDLNVGLVCGPISGNLAVLDADYPPFAVWCLTSPVAQVLLRRTWVVKTGSGKCHTLLRSEVPVATTTFKWGDKKLADLKAEGSYVAAPPSLHPETRQPYEHLIGGPEGILVVLDARRVFETLVNAYIYEQSPNGVVRVATPSLEENRILPALVGDALRPYLTKLEQAQVSPKIVRAIKRGAVPKEGEWSYCTSYSDIDHAVIAELVECGWSDYEIEVIFASCPIGEEGYRNTDRGGSYGWVYLAYSIKKMRLKVAQRREAAQAAEGLNFTVSKVEREEWPKEPLYKISMEAPHLDIKGTVLAKHSDILSHRNFTDVVARDLNFRPQFKAEHLGKKWGEFADILFRLAVSVPVAKEVTELGAIKQKIALTASGSNLYPQPPGRREDWTLGWRDEDEGMAYLHAVTLHERLKAQLRPMPQSRTMYDALKDMGGENRMVRYGPGESLRIRVWMVPLEELQAASG